MATKIFRFYDEVARPAQHLLSVVSDGSSASYVFPNRVEKSNNPKGLMKRALERQDAPDTPEGWAQMAADVMPMVSIQVVDEAGSVSTLTRTEQKILKDVAKEKTPSRGKDYGRGRDLELSDTIGSLMVEKPELSNFFESDDLEMDEPEAMRDYIRTILEHHNAVDLNPDLKEWLDGGEAPANFDGLVFFPETSSDKEEK